MASSNVTWDPRRLPKGVASVVTYRPDREVDQARTKELLTVFEQNYALYPPPASGGEDGDDPAAASR